MPMKRGVVLILLLALASLSMAVMAYQDRGQRGPGGAGGAGAGGAGRGGPPPALQTIKVRDNLYMIANGGGNTAIFITKTGVVLVDTKNPNNGPGIMDEVKKVSNKPVTMVIN